jgi:hypothetical protein
MKTIMNSSQTFLDKAMMRRMKKMITISKGKTIKKRKRKRLKMVSILTLRILEIDLTTMKTMKKEEITLISSSKVQKQRMLILIDVNYHNLLFKVIIPSL